jgi:quinol-cytochrome oxidoreductase complex cytochrome b subunit
MASHKVQLFLFGLAVFTAVTAVAEDVFVKINGSTPRNILQQEAETDNLESQEVIRQIESAPLDDSTAAIIGGVVLLVFVVLFVLVVLSFVSRKVSTEAGQSLSSQDIDRLYDIAVQHNRLIWGILVALLIIPVMFVACMGVSFIVPANDITPILTILGGIFRAYPIITSGRRFFRT